MSFVFYIWNFNFMYLIMNPFINSTRSMWEYSCSIRIRNLINVYSQKVSKTGIYKESALGNGSTLEFYDSKVKDTQENVESSIISKNIHGKYSRTFLWEGWKEQSESEDDFTVVSLHIPSNKKVSVHLKFYPADPIDWSIILDYKFMFER